MGTNGKTGDGAGTNVNGNIYMYNRLVLLQTPTPSTSINTFNQLGLMLVPVLVEVLIDRALLVQDFDPRLSVAYEYKILAPAPAEDGEGGGEGSARGLEF